MLIYHRAVSIEEGFVVLDEMNRANRLVRGQRVSWPSGRALFQALRDSGAPLKCWSCGIEASCFISNKGQNDTMGPPVLDLFAVDEVGRPILMTRDHIIPKSYGGSNDVANLRVGCGPCNHGRGNAIDEADIEFMKAHPELILPNPKLTLADGATSVEKTKGGGPARLTAEEKEAKKTKLREKRRAARKRRATKKAEKKANRLPPLTSMLALALA